MIVKIKSWKVPNFRRLIQYINNDKGRTKSGEIPIYHNILESTIQGAAKEFCENDVHRRQRSGGVAIYHEILSFHEEDSKMLNQAILDDIAQKYIQLRGDKALCFAKSHIHDRHFHIHFAFSGNEVGSNRVLRLDKNAFKRVRRQIEAYQIEKYSFLKKSVVYHSLKEVKKISDREFQLKKRTNEKSDKDVIADVLGRIFKKAKDFESFCNLITRSGYEVYLYRDRINGVVFNGRKYRFKNLGFGEAQFLEKERKVRELETIRDLIALQKAHKTVRQSAGRIISDSRSDLLDISTNKDMRMINRKIELRQVQIRRQYMPRMMIR